MILKSIFIKHKKVSQTNPAEIRRASAEKKYATMWLEGSGRLVRCCVNKKKLMCRCHKKAQNAQNGDKEMGGSAHSSMCRKIEDEQRWKYCSKICLPSTKH